MSGKPRNKLESPYTSHPKSDHNRSKSSYIKGPSNLKSIFQVYREAGISGKSSKEIKPTKDVNSTLPIHIGKDNLKIGGINFKLSKNSGKHKKKGNFHDTSMNSYTATINTRNRASKKPEYLRHNEVQKFSQNDYVQIEDRSHDFTNYLNSMPGSAALTEYVNRPIKSPTVNKAVSFSFGLRGLKCIYNL